MSLGLVAMAINHKKFLVYINDSVLMKFKVEITEIRTLVICQIWQNFLRPEP